MMKKHLAAFIAAALGFAACAVPVYADYSGLEHGDLFYEIADDGHIIITDCHESAEKMDVPAEIDGAPVMEIADSAFADCTMLESVTLPESITKIGRQAFSTCTSLESIDMPKELEYMGAGVFDECSSLKEVIFPSGITELPEATFYECTSLEGVILPEGVELIGPESFYMCSSLSQVTFPESVTSIGDYAFQGCGSMKSIDFPAATVNLGKYIFQDCISLTDINVAEENEMFCDDNGVLFTKDGVTLVRYPEAKEDTSYRVPDGCTQLANGSFVDAVNLKEIDLNQAVIYGMDVFFRCTGIEEITVPEGAVDISSSMFAYCSSLKNVELPSTVVNIYDYAFYTCAGFEEFTVPEGTQHIGAYAFFNCIGLKKLHLPDSIKELGDGAMGYYAETEDTEPQKLPGFVVEYDHNDVIYEFAKLYDLEGTGRGDSDLWKWLAIGAGVIVLVGAIVFIVIQRRKAMIPKPVKGGRTGSETKRPDAKKKG